ncbi:MAG: hypothetical protein RR348_01465 [Clostridia bacterium]
MFCKNVLRHFLTARIASKLGRKIRRDTKAGRGGDFMGEVINVPSQGAICWLVDTSEYRYNTDFVVGENVTAMLKFMGESFLFKSGEGGTIKQIVAQTLEANKKKVMFDKTKVDCVLYAKDDRAVVSIFWGLNIADIKGDEEKFFRLKTSGKYVLAVSNLEKFMSMLKTNAATTMVERDVKALMSANVLDMIRIGLERQINENSIQKLKDNKDAVIKKIVDEINLKIASLGMCMKELTAGLFDFVEQEKKVAEEFKFDDLV